VTPAILYDFFARKLKKKILDSPVCFRVRENRTKFVWKRSREFVIKRVLYTSLESEQSTSLFEGDFPWKPYNMSLRLLILSGCLCRYSKQMREGHRLGSLFQRIIRFPFGFFARHLRCNISNIDSYEFTVTTRMFYTAWVVIDTLFVSRIAKSYFP